MSRIRPSLDLARSRVVLALATPIVGGMVSQNLLNLVDMAMVGSLGKDAVAGVGLASFVFFVSFAAITGLSSAVQAIAARRIGEGRPEEAASGLHGAMLVSVVVGLPLSVGLHLAAPAIFDLLLPDPAARLHAVPYYQARLWAIVAVGANFAFRGFFNGVSRPGLYLRTLVVMHVVNVVVSYALIFGVAGFPKLGAEGAGVGTAIASWVGTLLYFAWGWAEARTFGFLGTASRLGAASLGGLLRLALPASIQQFLFSAGFTVLFWIMGQIGTAELAAANVLVNVTMVGILPAMGLGLASTTLVGQALGRGEPEEAWRWGWDVCKLTALALALIGLPMLVATDLILGLFLPQDPDVVALARWPLRLAAISLPIDGVGLVLINALLGAGAARTVMRVSVLSQWGLFLPAAWLVGPVLGWGILAVWLALGAQRALQALVLGIVWNRRGWGKGRV